MYMNKPSVTKIEAADRVNLLQILTAGSESTNLENLAKSPDMRRFMGK